MSFQKGNELHSYLKKILSEFIYRFAKTITANKLRENGRVVASIYDVTAVMVAWFCTYWLFIDSTLSVSLSKKLMVHPNWTLFLKQLYWIIPVQFILFRIFGLYRGFWRFHRVTFTYTVIKYWHTLGTFV